MPTSHYAFRALPLSKQLATIWAEGEYLARRWEDEDAVQLYYMPAHFFVEVYYDEETNHLIRCNTFTSAARLGLYADYLPLPPLQ